MNRLVQYLNLLGVLALAALCVVQWQRNRQLNLEVNRLEGVHHEQVQKLAEQEKSLRGLNEDLAHFKEKFGLTHSNWTEAVASLRKTETENIRIVQERDQLKGSISNWSGAVAARDLRLEEANQQIRSLSDKLNDSIHKFNSLATNYNSVVKQLDEARLALQTNISDKAKSP
jgi:chromosome segregation ATPase